MRKPKIILTAVAVLSVVGAIAAYNVRIPTVVFTHNPNDPLTKCTVPLTSYTTTAVGGTLTLATTTSTLPCAEIRIKTTD